MSDTPALTVPRGDEMCPRCDEPIGLHNGVKAIDCLIKLAHSAEHRTAAHGG